MNHMTTIEKLEYLYPDRIIEPSTIHEISRDKYLVYILTLNDQPVVVGHGKYNRAKIIFDDRDQITSNHVKALFVRIYRLFSDSSHFDQFTIECESKDEAKIIEAHLHTEIGGNKRNLSDKILNQLYDGFDDNSLEKMVLQMALHSSFDGIADIKKWRREGILKDNVWENIKNKLELVYK